MKNQNHEKIKKFLLVAPQVYNKLIDKKLILEKILNQDILKIFKMKLTSAEKLTLIRNHLAQHSDHFKDIGVGTQNDDNFDYFRPRVVSSPPPLEKSKLLLSNAGLNHSKEDETSERNEGMNKTEKSQSDVSSIKEPENVSEKRNSNTSVKREPRRTMNFLPSSDEEIIEVDSSRDSEEKTKDSSKNFVSFNNLDEIDIDGEKDSFIRNLQKATKDDDIDMRNYSFRNMSNPFNSMVFAHDLRDGTEYLVPKPSAFRKDLEKKRKKGEIPKKKDSPKRLRSKTQAELKRQSNTFKPQWDSYEKWRLV